MSSCISLPKIPFASDLERGACVVTLPDRKICTEMTLLACFDIEGEYSGDGSLCEDNIPYDSIASEPSPLYLDQKVIYSVGGTITTIVIAWAGIVVRKRRRKKRGR